MFVRCLLWRSCLILGTRIPSLPPPGLCPNPLLHPPGTALSPKIPILTVPGYDWPTGSVLVTSKAIEIVAKPHTAVRKPKEGLKNLGFFSLFQGAGHTTKIKEEAVTSKIKESGHGVCCLVPSHAV